MKVIVSLSSFTQSLIGGGGKIVSKVSMSKVLRLRRLRESLETSLSLSDYTHEPV